MVYNRHCGAGRKHAALYRDTTTPGASRLAFGGPTIHRSVVAIMTACIGAPIRTCRWHSRCWACQNPHAGRSGLLGLSPRGQQATVFTPDAQPDGPVPHTPGAPRRGHHCPTIIAPFLCSLPGRLSTARALPASLRLGRKLRALHASRWRCRYVGRLARGCATVGGVRVHSRHGRHGKGCGRATGGEG